MVRARGERSEKGLRAISFSCTRDGLVNRCKPATDESTHACAGLVTAFAFTLTAQWLATSQSVAPLPGLQQNNLLVPTSINSRYPSACDEYTYIVNHCDCEDIPSSNPPIEVNRR